jgi:hypothetical protein
LAVGAADTVLKSNGTVPGYAKIVNANVDAAAAISGDKIVAATQAVPGAVSTTSQAIGGVKTFHDGIKLDDAGGQTTLNYFVEGTFTPAVEGVSSGGTPTYDSRGGYYTRIGNTVFFACFAALTAHTGTGQYLMRNLPFAAVAGFNFRVNVQHSAYNLAAPGALIQAYVSGGSSDIYLFDVQDNGTETALTLDATSTVSISGWYRTA